jgi:alkylation response protein AidB-like acyl-CoA dehydrogenase
VDFQETDEQHMLRDATRRVLEAHSPLTAVRDLTDTDTGHDAQVWRRGADLGWAVLAVAEDVGGAGGDLVDLAIVAEEHGRMTHPGPLAPTALVANAIARLGSPEQRDAVLTSIAEGSATGAWAFAEPRQPWSTAGLRTRAEKTVAGYALTGVKTVVQGAGSARWLLVSTVLDDAPALFLVDTTGTQVSSRRLHTLDITRRFDEVALDGLVVDESALLGSGDDGATQRLLDEATVLVCADSVGAGGRLLEMTVDYVKVREQFGRPLGSFQAVKHKCANMRMWHKASWVATYHAAMALAAGTADASVAASTAKAYTSDAMSRLAGEALQTHGGIGFTWEHDLHLYLRRIKTDEVLYGDPALHRRRLCDHLVAGRADHTVTARG